MDGPAISGGTGGIEIAAGYVTIGADLSALRAAEQEAKDIVARIGGLTGNVGGAGGSIANPTNGASTGNLVLLSAKIDESALRTQIDTFFRALPSYRLSVELDYQRQPRELAAGPIDDEGPPNRPRRRRRTRPYGVEESGPYGVAPNDFVEPPRITATPATEAAQIAEEASVAEQQFAQRAAQDSYSRTIRGGGTGYNFNPFRVSSLAYRLGVPLAFAYGAEQLARFATSFTDAANIEANPQRILREFDNVGAQFDITQSQAAQLGSRQLARTAADQRMWQAAQSIPILGGFIGFGASIFDVSGRLEDQQFASRRAIQIAELSERERIETARGEAALTGSQEVVARQRIEQERAPLERAAATLPGLQAERTRIIDGRAQVSAGEIGAVDAQIKAAQEAQEVLDRRRDLDKQTIERAKLGDEAARISITTRGNIAESIIQSDEALIRRAPGDRMRSLEAQQQAERQAFSAETSKQVAAAGGENTEIGERVLASRAKEGQELAERQKVQRADTERSVSTEVQRISAEGDAAILRARGDAFAADLRLYQQHANEVRNATAGLSADQLRIVEEGLKKEEQAIRDAHAREVQFATGSAVASFAGNVTTVEGMWLQVHGDTHGAQMKEFDRRRIEINEQIRQAEQLPDDQRIPRLITLYGQRLQNESASQLTKYEFQRDAAEETYGYEERFKIAEDIRMHRPESARAESQVARAMMEYERVQREHGGFGTEDTVLRTRAKKALEAELNADRAELFGHHGGGVAISMGSAEALGRPGFSLDWRESDRQAAAGILTRGARAVAQGQNIPGLPDQALAGGDLLALVSDAKQVIQKFADAINKMANLKGVAMFAQ